MQFKRSIAVFCGSSAGSDPVIREAARRLGTLIGQQGRTLVFGGCLDGLMDTLAQSARQSGAGIRSVFIRGLYQPKDHLEGAEESFLPDVAERKAAMIRLADACIALPGGMGTLDELTTVAAMRQLGETACPVGLLNTAGFYDGLLLLTERMRTDGFLSPAWDGLFTVKSSPEELLEALDSIDD